MKTSSLLLIIATLLTTPLGAEPREFTDLQGRKVSGEITALAGDQVQIKRSGDGKLFAFPVKQLSEADQKFIGDYAAANVKHSFEVKYSRTKLGEKKARDGDVAVEEEQWAYKVALRNLSAVDAADVRVDYWVFRRADDGKIKAAPRIETSGSLQAVSIKKAATYEFATEPVTLTKTQLDAGWYYSNGAKSKSADKMGGMVVRIFKGEHELFAFGTDKDLLTAAKGAAGRKSAVDE